MELFKLRSQIRSIALALIAIIAFLLFLRISFELVDANPQNGFVDALYTFTDYLIDPFSGSVILEKGSDLEPFNFDALLALISYVAMGFIFIDFVTGFLYAEIKEIVNNFVDAIFKLIEFVLILRIVFEFFEIGTPKILAPGVVRLIYDVTEWTKFVNIDFVSDNIAWSTILALVIISVFDILSEQLINALFDFGNANSTKVEKKIIKNKAITTPSQQNITINVPVVPAVPPQQYTPGNPFVGANSNKKKP